MPDLFGVSYYQQSCFFQPLPLMPIIEDNSVWHLSGSQARFIEGKKGGDLPPGAINPTQPRWVQLWAVAWSGNGREGPTQSELRDLAGAGAGLRCELEIVQQGILQGIGSGRSQGGPNLGRVGRGRLLQEALGGRRAEGQVHSDPQSQLLGWVEEYWPRGGAPGTVSGPGRSEVADRT